VYGVFPKQILDFEKTYDVESSKWRTSSLLRGEKLTSATVELEVGRFWYAISMLFRPKVVLETGTHHGYSACCIAAALREYGGMLYTLDPESRKKHLWQGTDLEDKITYIQAYSTDSVEQLKGLQFDMLVLDAEHSYRTAMRELILYEPQLENGGVILMHDSLFYDGVGASVGQLVRNPRFEVVTLQSPRNLGSADLRCPGISIVRKVTGGEPKLEYEEKYDAWKLGSISAPPFLHRIDK